MRNAPRRCTATTESQSYSVILNRRLSRSIPALLTRMVGGPSSAAIRSTASPTSSARLTSAPTPIARPPAARTAATVSSVAPSARSSTPTARPSTARRRAIAAPIPFAAPVTMATRSADCCIPAVCPFRARTVAPGPPTSADVEARPPVGLRLHLADDLAHDGCRVAGAEQQIAQEVCDGVALRPLEVAVRADPGRVAQGEEDLGYRVRRRRAV